MRCVRFSSRNLGFRALVFISTLFFTFTSFLKHKLVEISEWPSENNASSSNTLNDFINCSDYLRCATLLTNNRSRHIWAQLPRGFSFAHFI